MTPDKHRENDDGAGLDGGQQGNVGNNVDPLGDSSGEILDPQQAYANEKWLSKYRFDPKIGESNDEGVACVNIKEKIHLFCLDLGAFKQIRTVDVMNHFRDFGPSYIEWLGETSLNVMFEDEFSASRALKSLGQDIPERVPKDGKGADRNDNDYDNDNDNDNGIDDMDASEKLNDTTTSTNDENAVENMDAEDKVNADVATDEIDPSDGDDPMGATTDNAAANEASTQSKQQPSLSSFGWKFCKSPIVKKRDDRWGRAGTRSRYLIRHSTNFDALDAISDVVKLKPPKSFSTDRVIGAGGGGRKRRKSNNSRNNGDDLGGGMAYQETGEPRGLDGALRSSR